MASLKKRIPGRKTVHKKQSYWKKVFNTDSLAKATPLILGLGAIVLSFWQYNKGVEREFRKNYYERQVQAYNELTELCSKIANYKMDFIATPPFDSLESKLNESYHGRLTLYENESVDDEVSNFLLLLQRFKRSENAEEPVDNLAMQKQLFKITQACRLSLSQTYAVYLKELQPSIEFGIAIKQHSGTKDMTALK